MLFHKVRAKSIFFGIFVYCIDFLGYVRGLWGVCEGYEIRVLMLFHKVCEGRAEVLGGFEVFDEIYFERVFCANFVRQHGHTSHVSSVESMFVVGWEEGWGCSSSVC